MEIYISNNLGVNIFNNNIVPENEEIRAFFYRMKFYFPIPFKKGEILNSIRNPENKYIFKGRMKNKKDVKCYCIYENGEISEWTCNPFLLESDNNKYDAHSIQGAFSRYIKKKISIVDFLNIYDANREMKR
ncbi:MAG: hypothetical protein K6B68_10575 [Eubacterium sp.]|nr:hypothetical protein [Eubacterium sp.]